MTGELGVHIATEIADREGIEPTALPPLHEVVDLDALTSLFESTDSVARDGPGTASFTYQGYDVTVTASGDVRIQSTHDTSTAVETGRETAIE